jgi:hypothetical protein
MAKLTLSVEPDKIAKAKRYASKHHTSISKIFSEFISGVTEKEETEEDPFLTRLKNEPVSPEIEALRGILQGKVADDINLWDAKYEYLKEKYDL